GGAYGSGTDYTNYNTKAGTKRRTATLGQNFDLGGGLNAQVVCLKGKTISGDSVVIPSGEENGMSMGLLISYNGFRLISAGDIAGYNSGDYKNVESILAPDIGQVNVLHVNHHSSASSSNPTWVSTLNPQVSLISLGAGNPYGYPKQETLNRLTSDPGGDNHIYQTETGNGGTIPSGRGHICNSNIWVVVNSSTYTVWGESYSIAKGGDIASVLPAELPVPVADGFAISAVSPNPVRGGHAVVRYQLQSRGQVTIELYNMLGQKVETIVNSERPAGIHTTAWNGAADRTLASGVYLFRMAVVVDGRRYESSRRILLMK
ncbi:T9SS type A sorting domain-containing protein, partial [bacterium]|nr:T9SS type A sorting domain-containing protein [bacterium]